MTQKTTAAPGITPAIKKYMSALGRRGGAAGRGSAKARPSATMRRAQAASVAARRRKKLAAQNSTTHKPNL